MPYDKLSKAATIQPKPFECKIPDLEINKFKEILKISPIGPPTYENTKRPDGQYGIQRDWLIKAKDHWLNTYDWKKTEKRINSFPNYTVDLKAKKDSKPYTVHFTALLSDKPDAIPVCLIHGWPGSVLEFMYYLDLVRNKYKPEEMPYSFIVPSMPGYGFSGGPSLDEEWDNEDMAYLLNELMVGLGYGGGYIAHGGDIGSFLSRIMAVRYDACKAIHLNFCLMGAEPEGVDQKDVTDVERENVKRMVEFGTTGNAYAKEHGTKGGTIGLCLSSSPIALLCWIGEKYFEWTDKTPDLDDILDSVTLYWYTDTFPRGIYPYIDFFGRGDKSTVFHPDPNYYCKKPIGFSYFPFELAPIPIAWAKKTGNIVWHRSHTSGGHFAALEKPKELLQDMEEFMQSSALGWKSS